MKKTVILIFLILVFYYSIFIFISKNNIKIPNESIRIRVIANSNLDIDQNIKKVISNNVMLYLNNELKGINNIIDARNKIISLTSNINRIINDTLITNNINQGFKLTYGYNYFPEKEFLDHKYKEGYYESLLITLGSGLGDNFWCLLFPPLCMLDNTEDVEYTTLISELFNV